MKPESHPLIQNISEVAKSNPLMYSVLDPAFNRYLLDTAKIVNLEKSKKYSINNSNRNEIKSNPFEYEPYFPYPVKDPYENIMGWNPDLVHTSGLRYDNSIERNQIVSTLTTKTDAVQILNWLSLISLYLMEKGMVLEPFQKYMIVHAIMFAASEKIPHEMHIIEKIILAFFDVDSVNKTKFIQKMDELREQFCIYIVPRRMGKTLTLEILTATCALATRLKLAYFSHSGGLCSEIKMHTAVRIGELYEMICQLKDEHKNRFRRLRLPRNQKNVTVSQKTAWLNLKFEQGDSVTIQYLTLGNQEV